MTVDLELWEINLILNVLAEQSYKEVATTIQSIKEQVDKQS